MDEILTTKEYWNLLGREPILAITWEPDFFQARSSEELTDKDGQTLPISQTLLLRPRPGVQQEKP